MNKENLYHAIIGSKLVKNLKLSEFTRNLSEVLNNNATVIKIMKQHSLNVIEKTFELSLSNIHGDNGDIFLIKGSDSDEFTMVLGKESLIKEIEKYHKEDTICEYINYTKDVHELKDVTSQKQFERINTIAEFLKMIDEEGLLIDEKKDLKEINSFESFFKEKESKEGLVSEEVSVNTEDVITKQNDVDVEDEPLQLEEEEEESNNVGEELELNEYYSDDSFSDENTQIVDKIGGTEITSTGNPIFDLEERMASEHRTV